MVSVSGAGKEAPDLTPHAIRTRKPIFNILTDFKNVTDPRNDQE